MAMGISEIVFSGFFILLGSIIFQISAFLSGYNIYKEHNLIESSYLSIVAGILVFLLSPIGHITLCASGDSRVMNYFIELFDKNVIYSFLSCAFGIGLIVGSLIVINARAIIMWFIRDHSRLPFLIYTSSDVWDYIIASIKYNGEIKIATRTLGTLEGFLIASSFRKQPKGLIIKVRDKHSHVLIT
jgi:hypothetical protein